MTHLTVNTGQIGENLGVKELQKRGYKILIRNYKCKLGEIDVITEYKGFLVFVEIKTRRQILSGYPAESVHEAKQRKIGQIALFYMQEHKTLDRKARFDVVSVLLDENEHARIEVIEDAFEV